MRVARYAPFVSSYFVKKYPVELTLFVTGRCNFRCAHCFYVKDEGTPQRDELSLEELQTIARKSPRLLRLLLSGGEPFLREDLPAICQAFHDHAKAVHISIPTNASLPERIATQTEEILRRCPDSFVNLGLSLNATGADRDRFVGQAGSFESFEETYARLREVAKRHRNLGVGVIAAMHRGNQEEIVKIYEYASRELKADHVVVPLIRGAARDATLLDVDLKYYRELKERIARDARQRFAGRMRFPFFNTFLTLRSLGYEVCYQTRTRNQLVLPCTSGSLRGVINERGEVYPCETFMGETPEQKLGDLRAQDYDLRAIWDSAAAAQIRGRIRSGACCCANECDVLTSIAFNPRLLPRLILGTIPKP